MFWFRHPRSGSPAELGQASACTLAVADRRSAFFAQSHLEAFSATSVLSWTALPSSAWLTFVSTAELGATGNSWMKHGLCFPLHWWISFLVRYDGASDHVMFFFSFPFPFYCQHPCRPGSLLYGVGTFSPCLCGFSSLLLPPPTFQRRDWWIELLYWPQVWMCGWMVVPQLSHVNATGRGSSPQTTPVWDKSMDDEWKNSIIVQLS